MTHLATGTMLAGYRIERLLGQGGMGVVYLADQLSLDRRIALKLISPDHSRDGDFRERFLRESHLAASIDHPNIVPVHEAGEEDGVLYVAMRYVEGCDLQALLRADGAVGSPRAARIAAQIGAALDAAHARGLVHRDVKPANILLADPGGAEHCYLTDFGLTKQTAASTDLTQTGTVMGTVHYIAPEQLRGEAVDGRADVYALGCVLYELLAGRPPFVRDTDVATLFAHISQAPPSLEGPLDDVVQRALAKDPADRFQSAGELGRAAELGATQSGTIRVTAPAVPAVPQAAAPRRRRPRIALLAAGAVVLVGLVAAALVLLRGEEELRVDERVALGGVPYTATLFGSTLWITLEDEGRLAAVDVRSGRVTQSAELGASLSATAAGGTQLWVGDYGETVEDGRGAVVPFDPRTGRAGREIATVEPYELVADGESLWISDLSEFIQRIDLRSGTAGEPIRVDRPFDIVLHDGRLWVVANGAGELVPYDARTGERSGRPISIGARPLAAASDGDAIWVVTEPGRLVRAVPSTGRTSAVAIGPPDPIRNIAASDQGVWVVDGNGKIILADRERPDAQRTAQLGGELSDVEPDGAGAWALDVTSGEGGTAVRVAAE